MMTMIRTGLLNRSPYEANDHFLRKKLEDGNRTVIINRQLRIGAEVQSCPMDFIPALVILIASVSLLAQLATGLYSLLKFAANPRRKRLRPVLLTVATVLASIGLCCANVFPRAFVHGLCTQENHVDLFLYLFAMFVGILFSYELLLSDRNRFRLTGMVGLFFLVINLTPGVSDYMFNAQFKPQADRDVRPSQNVEKPLDGQKALAAAPPIVARRMET